MQSGWTTSNRVILQQLCRKTWHLTWWMTQSKRHNKTKDFWWKMYLIILEKVFLLKWNKNLFLFLINKAINTIPYVNWATSVHQKTKITYVFWSNFTLYQSCKNLWLMIEILKPETGLLAILPHSHYGLIRYLTHIKYPNYLKIPASKNSQMF